MSATRLGHLPCFFCGLRRPDRRAMRLGSFSGGQPMLGQVCRFCEQAASDAGVDVPPRIVAKAAPTSRESVMQALREHGPMTGVDLTDRTGCDSGAVSRALVALTAAGQVERWRPCGAFRQALVNRVVGDVREPVSTAESSKLAGAKDALKRAAIRVERLIPPAAADGSSPMAAAESMSAAGRIAGITGLPHRDVVEALASGRTERDLLALARRSA